MVLDLLHAKSALRNQAHCGPSTILISLAQMVMKTANNTNDWLQK
jgi:hypothetical protein